MQAVEQGFESLLREYNQVRDDVAQGLGFYGQLQDAVKTLHQEVGDYCLARSDPLSTALLPCLEGVAEFAKPCLIAEQLMMRAWIVVVRKQPCSVSVAIWQRLTAQRCRLSSEALEWRFAGWACPWCTSPRSPYKCWSSCQKSTCPGPPCRSPP